MNLWSGRGTLSIIRVAYFRVHLGIQINEWLRGFYDAITSRSTSTTSMSGSPSGATCSFGLLISYIAMGATIAAAGSRSA
jgi:ABC-type long-subunit fatty acid transport system fused permease/ATPase subunit